MIASFTHILLTFLKDNLVSKFIHFKFYTNEKPYVESIQKPCTVARAANNQ